jgi:predicted MFS family arabinose efflux permease
MQERARGTSPPIAPGPPRALRVIAILGTLQVLAWGSTFYLLAVLAPSIVRETGWSYQWVMAGVCIGLFVAGVVSPPVGRAINAYGGRPVLAAGAAVLAIGQVVIGSAQNFVWYLAGWTVLGAGMGAGLYDAAFSSLGVIYGKNARSAITAVTLFGGFASTVCWPISAYLVEHFGWRVTCFVYAGIYLGIAFPLYLTLPARGVAAAADASARTRTLRLQGEERAILAVLAAVLTIAAAILATMGAHLVTLLQARGLDLAEAVALGMIIGPAAVGARFVEMLAGKRYHPIWTMIASSALVALGMALFFVGRSVFALAIALYAAGNGIGSIAKGTLPLALFGPERYPILMGRLGLPILVAMALAPFAGAVAYQHAGAAGTFMMVAGLAGTNVVLVAALWLLSRRLIDAS